MSHKLLVIGPLMTVLCLTSPSRARDPLLANAAEKRDATAVQELLAGAVPDVDVNAGQADGMTALHWATLHDDTELVSRLIEAGADVRSTNRYGVAPLSLACQNGNGEIVKQLLAAGADPNTEQSGGETALMTAARTGRLEPVKQLIAHGADVAARERKQQTALMWAAAEGHADVVNALLAAGADRDAQLGSGFTPFFFAVREGRVAVVRRLVAAGCDVNAVMQSTQGYKFGRGRLRLTPLLLAVENGHFELARMLLELGADAGAQPAGYAALHAITWVRKPIRGDGDPPPRGSGPYSSLDMVRFLVEAGANVDARLERGRSELGRFTYTGSTPFLLAAQTGDLSLMRLLVELGADPTIPNADGSTPLLAAAGVGALGDGDETAGTEDEAIAAIEYLLELGDNVNAVDDNGETAMHGAAYQSHATMVKMLVEHGADAAIWNRANRAGWTPRVIALGYRPGNFRPAPETIAAIEQALVAADIPVEDVSDLGAHKRGWSGTSNDSKSWVLRDIEYARVGNTRLLLDLHMPAHVHDSSLIVWIHGGAWRAGSKDDMPLQTLVESGYTVASVDYRLSTVAPFPAQVHDIKAAIRHLRAIADHYGYRSERMAIAGASAGGHLAALVGTTADNDELAGNLGSAAEQSAAVQAIVSLYGPTNLTTILSQSTPHGLSVRVPALDLLLGGQPEDRPARARLASPVHHVDPSDPPLLLIHGDQDLQVPINQSHELQGMYEQQGLPVRFEVVHGGGHGGDLFYDEQRSRVMRDFLDSTLRDE